VELPGEIAQSVAEPKQLGHPLFVEKNADVIRLLRGQPIE
jgi:hypothetical protein